MRVDSLLAALCLTALPSASLSQNAPPPYLPTDLTPAGVRAADDHLALEQTEGAEAMAFVAESNAKALAALTNDPRYEPFRQQALDILTATDRYPTPRFLGGRIGNFWQDAANPKGLWRTTTLSSYRTARPEWRTLLDVDALSKAEGKDWVFHGTECLAPEDARCVVALSDGGKDAVVIREFDTAAGAWVEGGFNLPEGKHRLEWLDRDTLLVGTDFGPGTLTESGYPYILKALKRGQPLDEAQEVYRGAATDGGYGLSPDVLRDDDGRTAAVLVYRPLDTFRSETVLLADGAPVVLDLPQRVTVHGAARPGPGSAVDLIFTIGEPWRGHPSGALMRARLNDLRASSGNDGQTAAASEIYVPGARQSVEDVAVFDHRVVATVFDNVRGRALVFADRGDGTWTQTALAVPENVAVYLGGVNRRAEQFFYSIQGFLTPSALNLGDAAGAAGELVKQAPSQFDASTHVVEQFEAASTDGTKIPYFVTRPRDQNGPAPTILYGYGGFQASMTPAYDPELGKLWLENGGVFVQANIRGGGEFGPAWHEAAMKSHRQLSFDDFAAVARDLEARGITTPRRLGIYGRSNGGVLTSVSITQHPELFHAAVIESPVIDMLRYYELPPGASWIGEFGDPRIPQEAAYLARYSAYQQVRPGANYPRVYITTNTHDDRVHPGHARKFSARLTGLGYDNLYYEDTTGGHSNDADPVANARRWARHYVYLSQQLMDQK